MGYEVRLGVDIGRVIIGGARPPGEGEDTSFFQGGMDAVLRTPAAEGALETLPRLVERVGGRAWLVSKCGERTERRTLAWLDYHDFYNRTGIPPDHVRFCRARPDKAIHCRELGITDFIDDRLDVHQALRGVVPRRYLFGPQPQPPPYWVTPTSDWPSVAKALEPVLSVAP